MSKLADAVRQLNDTTATIAESDEPITGALADLMDAAQLVIDNWEN